MRKTDRLELNLLESTDKISLDPINENVESLERAVTSMNRTNLLDNWYFADAINQRGQTEYTGMGYFVDRWHSVSGDLTIKLPDEGLSVSKADSNQYQSLSQYVPVPKEAAGQKCTLSIRMRAPDMVCLRVYSNYTSGTLLSVAQGYCVDGVLSTTFTIGDNTEKLMILIYPHYHIGASFSDTVLIAAKLEFGSTQTIACQDADGSWVMNDPPPDKGMELLKCIQSTADPTDTYANKLVLHTGNVTAGTTDITAGHTALGSGSFYDVYE